MKIPNLILLIGLEKPKYEPLPHNTGNKGDAEAGRKCIGWQKMVLYDRSM
jgi:hypothetical protein